MSLTFTFTDTSSQLSADFFPPLELDPGSEFMIGLLSFDSYNAIPNVTQHNNKFHFEKNKVIEIPVGIYDVNDIQEYLQTELRRYVDKNYVLAISANNNTMRASIKATFEVDFTPDDSIGRLLGFDRAVLQARKRYTSSSVVDIFQVNSIRVDCNIASGSFVEGKAAHSIFEFFPSVPAGYKLLETPSPVVYLPINTRRIENITLSVVDQRGNLVDFRGERITIRLHLKKLGS